MRIRTPEMATRNLQTINAPTHDHHNIESIAQLHKIIRDEQSQLSRRADKVARSIERATDFSTKPDYSPMRMLQDINAFPDVGHEEFTRRVEYLADLGSYNFNENCNLRLHDTWKCRSPQSSVHSEFVLTYGQCQNRLKITVKEHHVHFSGGSGMGKDNNIMIQPQRHGHIDAHLGFLQLHHRYHVEFSVPWNVCIHGEGQTIAPAVVVGNSNPNCAVIDFTQDKDGLRLKVELLAYKEKIIREEVQLMCCKSGSPLKILLHARVLGKDKGTPLLRNGIRSIAVEDDDEDDDISE